MFTNHTQTLIIIANMEFNPTLTSKLFTDEKALKTNANKMQAYWRFGKLILSGRMKLLLCNRCISCLLSVFQQTLFMLWYGCNKMICSLKTIEKKDATKLAQHLHSGFPCNIIKQ